MGAFEGDRRRATRAELIWINDNKATLANSDMGDASLLKTYTVYLIDGQPAPRFKPVMALTDTDALREARKILNAHPECEAIEVHFGRDVLFQIGRA